MNENQTIEFNPHSQEGMNNLMDAYDDSKTMYPGVNENGEIIHISIFHEFIVVMTFQSNGWTRKNVYHRDGTREELFEGRWKE